jgi:hypothetical protein
LVKSPNSKVQYKKPKLKTPNYNKKSQIHQKLKYHKKAKFKTPNYNKKPRYRKSQN